MKLEVSSKLNWKTTFAAPIMSFEVLYLVSATSGFGDVCRHPSTQWYFCGKFHNSSSCWFIYFQFCAIVLIIIECFRDIFYRFCRASVCIVLVCFVDLWRRCLGYRFCIITLLKFIILNLCSNVIWVCFLYCWGYLWGRVRVLSHEGGSYDTLNCI